MKKVVATILAAIGMIVLLPASTFALSPKTDVTGTVTNNGSPVSGAHVIVICHNNKKSTTTDASGSYLVQYNAGKCPAGSTVFVTATKGKKGGDSTGTASSVTTHLNVALVNVSLPEFGLITGVGATIIGGGAFLVMRRRQLSGHKA